MLGVDGHVLDNCSSFVKMNRPTGDDDDDCAFGCSGLTEWVNVSLVEDDIFTEERWARSNMLYDRIMTGRRQKLLIGRSHANHR